MKNNTKKPLRFVYENGQSATMNMPIPVVAIELETGARLSTRHGSIDQFTAEEALAFARENGCLPVNLADLGEVRSRQAEVNQKFQESHSNVCVPYGNIWTYNPETNEMEAFSTRDGIMMQYGNYAGLLLKLQ